MSKNIITTSLPKIEELTSFEMVNGYGGIFTILRFFVKIDSTFCEN